MFKILDLLNAHDPSLNSYDDREDTMGSYISVYLLIC